MGYDYGIKKGGVSLQIPSTYIWDLANRRESLGLLLVRRHPRRLASRSWVAGPYHPHTEGLGVG
jgi:hypothetical protein